MEIEEQIKILPPWILISYNKQLNEFTLYDIHSKKYVNEFNSKTISETIDNYLDSLGPLPF